MFDSNWERTPPGSELYPRKNSTLAPPQIQVLAMALSFFYITIAEAIKKTVMFGRTH